MVKEIIINSINRTRISGLSIKANSFLNTLHPLLIKSLRDKHSIELENLDNASYIPNHLLILYKIEDLRRIDTNEAKYTILALKRKVQIKEEYYNTYFNIINSSQIELKKYIILTKYAYIYSLYLNKFCHSSFLRKEINRLQLNNILTDLLLLSKMSYEKQFNHENDDKFSLLISTIQRLGGRIVNFSPNWMYIFAHQLLINQEKMDPLKKWELSLNNLYQSHYTNSVIMLLINTSIVKGVANKKEREKLYYKYLKTLLNTDVLHQKHIINYLKIIDNLRFIIPIWRLSHDLISIIIRLENLDIRDKKYLLEKLQSRLHSFQQNNKGKRGKLINFLLLNNPLYLTHKSLKFRDSELQLITLYLEDKNNLSIEELKEALIESLKLKIPLFVNHFLNYYINSSNEINATSYKEIKLNLLDKLPNLSFFIDTVMHFNNNKKTFSHKEFLFFTKLILGLNEASEIAEKFLLNYIQNSKIDESEHFYILNLIEKVKNPDSIFEELINANNLEIIISIANNQNYLARLYKHHPEIVKDNILYINYQTATDFLLSLSNKKNEMLEFINYFLVANNKDIEKSILYLGNLIYKILINDTYSIEKAINVSELIEGELKKDKKQIGYFHNFIFLQQIIEKLRNYTFTTHLEEEFENKINQVIFEYSFKYLTTIQNISPDKFREMVSFVKVKALTRYCLHKILLMKDQKPFSKILMEEYIKRGQFLYILHEILYLNTTNDEINRFVALTKINQKNSFLLSASNLNDNNHSLEYKKLLIIYYCNQLIKELKKHRALNKKSIQNVDTLFQFLKNNSLFLSPNTIESNYNSSSSESISFIDQQFINIFDILLNDIVMILGPDDKSISTTMIKDVWQFKNLLSKDYLINFKIENDEAYKTYLLCYSSWLSFNTIYPNYIHESQSMITPLIKTMDYLILLSSGGQFSKNFLSKIEELDRLIQKTHAMSCDYAIVYFTYHLLEFIISRKNKNNQIDFFLNKKNKALFFFLLKRAYNTTPLSKTSSVGFIRGIIIKIAKYTKIYNSNKDEWISLLQDLVCQYKEIFTKEEILVLKDRYHAKGLDIIIASDDQDKARVDIEIDTIRKYLSQKNIEKGESSKTLDEEKNKGVENNQLETKDNSSSKRNTLNKASSRKGKARLKR